MKRSYFFERPRRMVSAQVRDVPIGTVVLDREGFWGVREYGRIDRWDAPPIAIRHRDVVLVPYGKWLKTKRSRASAIRPTNGSTLRP